MSTCTKTLSTSGISSILFFTPAGVGMSPQIVETEDRKEVIHITLKGRIDGVVKYLVYPASRGHKDKKSGQSVTPSSRLGQG